MIEVVAAVISDPSGRVLVARRPPGRPLAGQWEFPGGKCETDESAQAALARELREELGVDIAAAEPLMRVPNRMGERAFVLDVHRVRLQRGSPPPQPLEGQQLAWLQLEELHGLPMPPADLPVVAALTQPSLYLITPEPDGGVTADDDFLRLADAALRDGSIGRLQIRLKTTGGARRVALVEALAASARRHSVEVLLNPSVDALDGDLRLARDLDLGLHLGSILLSGWAARQPPAWRPGVLAASCHDGLQLAAAARRGVDFVVLSPVAPTRSHPAATPLGWTEFARLRAESSLPIYALGGLGRSDLPAARAHGAQGIAAISALWPRT